ncbi:MAG: hypothetical protein JWO82_2823, partial [Akkermansiaceae bacterium]|nr:hypothetical protein [Akkermansiaceae bacterium]
MKNICIQATGALMAVLMIPSCMNTYDSYGRPVQSVDPNAAVGAAALAGVAGYAIGKNNGKKNYYGGPGYYGGGRPYYGGRPSYYGGRR